jgi:hypothetical protein
MNKIYEKPVAEYVNFQTEEPIMQLPDLLNFTSQGVGEIPV